MDLSFRGIRGEDSTDSVGEGEIVEAIASASRPRRT